MKRLVGRLLAGVGQTLVPTWRMPGLPMATCVRHIIASRQITTVIDVGANRGQYRNFLRTEVGYQGRIISFEPVPELARTLQQKAASDPNWTVRGCALGATAGERTLNVMSSTVFSSFLQPKAVDQFDVENLVTRTETVPVSTLDAEIADPGVLSTAYLKLDTQGFDLEVLRGAPVAARSIPAMQSEISFRPIYEGMPTFSESLAEFTRLGFAVSDLFVVSKNAIGVAVEFDCILVRDPALLRA